MVFYIGSELYRTRPDKSLSASEVFNLMWSEPDTVTHAYFNGNKYGPIGNFEGQNIKSTSVEVSLVA